MAGSETQFQQPGMQVPQPSYATVPTETRNIQLADYRPMMQAIESAGQTILNSPINPEVRARMQSNVAQSQAVQSMIKTYKDAGLLPLVTNVAGGAPNIGLAGVPAGTASYIATKLFGPKTPGGGGKDKETVNPETAPEGGGSNKPAAGVGEQETPNAGPESIGNLPTGPTDPNASTGGLGQVNTPTENGLASAGANTGANAFAPPNAGLVSAAPPAPVRDVDVSKVANNQATQDNQPAQMPGNLVASTDNNQLLRTYFQQKQAEDEAAQQRLAQWQNTNQGSVMSAVQAKEWAQHNLDTDINRAVYLPQGGPPNAQGQKEPAYAFYGRKGGTNIVPISQMVKAGAGALVAAQNSSQVLNTADQATKTGGVPLQNAPPYQGQLPAASGSPPSTNAQQGPPAAPAGPADRFAAQPGQLPTDEFNRRVAEATNVPAAGGPPVQNLTAQVGGNNNGGHFSNGSTTDENGFGKAGNNDGSVNQGGNWMDYLKNTTGMTPERFNQLKATPRTGETNPSYPGDPVAFQDGDWKWYEDDHSGKYYTTRTGEQLFYQGRLYFGDNQFHQFPLPQQELARNLHAKEPQLSMDELTDPKIWSRDRLSAELNKWVQMDYKNQMGLMPQETSDNIDHLGKEIQSLTRLGHAIAGLEPRQYDDTALAANKWRRGAENAEPSENQGVQGVIGSVERALQSGMGGGNQSDQRLNFISKERGGLKALMGGLRAGNENEQEEYRTLMDQWGTKGFQPALEDYLHKRQADFVKAVKGATQNNQRVPGFYTDMTTQLLNKEPWHDPDDTYGPGSRLPKGPAQTKWDTVPRQDLGINQTPNATPTPPARITPPNNSADNPVDFSHFTGPHGSAQGFNESKKYTPGTWVKGADGKVFQIPY